MASEQKEFERTVTIAKRDNEKRLVFGIVYEPDTVDAHGDYATEDEIEKAAHSFAHNGAQLKLEHEAPANGVAVSESYIVRDHGYKLSEGESSTNVKKGSWVIVVKVFDDAIWDAVKKGEITGFSMGGRAKRMEAAA